MHVCTHYHMAPTNQTPKANSQTIRKTKTMRRESTTQSAQRAHRALLIRRRRMLISQTRYLRFVCLHATCLVVVVNEITFFVFIALFLQCQLVCERVPIVATFRIKKKNTTTMQQKQRSRKWACLVVVYDKRWGSIWVRGWWVVGGEWWVAVPHAVSRKSFAYG